MSELLKSSRASSTCLLQLLPMALNARLSLLSLETMSIVVLVMADHIDVAEWISIE